MNIINVVYQFNEKYVTYAGVSMTSLLVNNQEADEINIYVLGESLTSESKNILEECVAGFGRKVFFPETDGMIDKFRSLGMIPYRGAYSVYLRLFFTELLDIGERALYLDADTIVDGSLIPLINYDLNGRSVGMVLESIRDDYKIMIGMDESSDYFNSGVILFDVDKWKKNRYCDKIVDHIRNVRSSYIGDQDFLNLVCEGDVCRLPIVYNYQPLHGRYSAKEYFKAYTVKTSYGSDGNMVYSGYYSPEEIEIGRDSVVVYHCYRWLGEFPWDKGNLHPFNGIFDRYLYESIWAEYKKKRANTGIILKIEKILYLFFPKRVFLFFFKKAHEMMLKRAEKNARLMKMSRSA